MISRHCVVVCSYVIARVASRHAPTSLLLLLIQCLIRTVVGLSMT